MTWTDLVAIIGDTEPLELHWEGPRVNEPQDQKRGRATITTATCADFDLITGRLGRPTITDDTIASHSGPIVRHAATSGPVVVSHICWPWLHCEDQPSPQQEALI